MMGEPAILAIVLLVVALVVLALVMASLPGTHHSSAWALRRGAPRAAGGDEAKKKTLNVQEPWFTAIAEGKKTVEGRVGQPTSYADLEGLEVEIRGPEGRTARVKVTSRKHYPTLDDYVKGEGWARVAPHTKSDAEALAAYRAVMMPARGGRHKKAGKQEGVFSDERVQKSGGIVALRIKVARN